MPGPTPARLTAAGECRFHGEYAESRIRDDVGILIFVRPSPALHEELTKHSSSTNGAFFLPSSPLKAMYRCRYSVLFLLVLAAGTVRAQQPQNYEQIALDFFLHTYWNASLFEGECTGLTYDSSFAILVNSEGPAFKIDSSVVDAHLPLSGGKSLIGSAQRNGPFHLLLNGDHPALRRTGLRSAPSESEGIRTLERDRDLIIIRKNFTAYFLRFSERLELNGHTYLDLWIKQGYSSSGAHMIVEMDGTGRVLRHARYTRCDDEG